MLDHLQAVVDESGKSYPTLKKWKSLISQMYIHEIVPKDRNVVCYVDIKKAGNLNAINRKSFSKKEIAKVWEWSNKNVNEYISVVLMLIYTGVRISELLV